VKGHYRNSDSENYLFGKDNMLQKFKATLTGNQIQWLDEIPASLTHKKSTEVYIIFLESESTVDEINETTLSALKEIESGKGEVFKNVDELFKDLDNS
jgi:hypothetical protein